MGQNWDEKTCSEPLDRIGYCQGVWWTPFKKKKNGGSLLKKFDGIPIRGQNRPQDDEKKKCRRKSLPRYSGKAKGSLGGKGG